MLIGLISDTHIPAHARELPYQLKEVFHGVDLILHAGDVYLASVLNELEHLAPILAAEGDDDPLEIMNDKRVKQKQVITVEGTTIWLVHERPWFWPPGSERTAQHEKTPDVIVFGHTHEASLENSGGILKVNPGSATFPSYKRELGTVGLLTVNSGKAEVQIIQLQ